MPTYTCPECRLQTDTLAPSGVCFDCTEKTEATRLVEADVPTLTREQPETITHGTTAGEWAGVLPEGGYRYDEKPLGVVTKSVVGLALDLDDARGKLVLRFEKRLGDIWGFTVVDPRGQKIGDVSRGFSNIEVDVSVLGGIGLDRSMQRDDFELTFDEVSVDALSVEVKALVIAATFLVAQTSSAGSGAASLFD